MIPKNTDYKIAFKKLYKRIELEHERLKLLAKERKKDELDQILPRALRLLRVRYKVILGISFSFNEGISLTKTERVKNTYIEIFKNNEGWFAYEGLIKLVTSEVKKSDDFAKIPDVYFKEHYKLADSIKIFNKLVKEFNYYDNELGTKYLLFYMMDLDTKKIDGYIGTIIVLDNPLVVERNGNQIEITHRNIVTRYTEDMKDIFV